MANTRHIADTVYDPNSIDPSQLSPSLFGRRFIPGPTPPPGGSDQGLVAAPTPPVRPASFPNAPTGPQIDPSVGPSSQLLPEERSPTLFTPPSGPRIPALYGAPAGTPGPAPSDAQWAQANAGALSGSGGSWTNPAPAAPAGPSAAEWAQANAGPLSGGGGSWTTPAPAPALATTNTSPSTYGPGMAPGAPFPPPHSAAVAARGGAFPRGIPAALPPARGGGGGGGVPLPPPHMAAVAARGGAAPPNPAAPASPAYPPPTQVQGPAFLRNFILAGQQPPGAQPSVGGSLAAMLNRGTPYGGAGQGGGRS